MSDMIKDSYDRASALKDIAEREQIIRTFQLTGCIDRDKAIEKIKELRLNDAEVAAVTTVRLAVSSTPFSVVSDQGIVAELQMQVEILSAKLTENKNEV